MEEIEWIERYLRHELTLEERKIFEDRLATDSRLLEQLQLHQEALEAVRIDAREKMKAQLKTRWRPDEFASKPPFPWFRWLIGSLVVFGGITFWLLKKSDKIPTHSPLIQAAPHDTLREEIPATLQDTLHQTRDVKKDKEAHQKKLAPDAQKIYASYFKPYTSNELQIQVRALE